MNLNTAFMGLSTFAQGTYKVCSTGYGFMTLEATTSIYLAGRWMRKTTAFSPSSNVWRDHMQQLFLFAVASFAIKAITGQLSIQNFKRFLSQQEIFQSVLTQTALKAMDTFMITRGALEARSAIVGIDENSYQRDSWQRAAHAGRFAGSLGYLVLRGIALSV
jgi:hypothetical protein